MTPAIQAETLVALIREELQSAGDSETDRRIILGIIRRFLDDHPDTPANPEPKIAGRPPMGEEESKRFELRILPAVFKRYAGNSVANVPIDYLCVLTEPNPFLRQLNCYLESRRGRERIEREDL